MEFRFGSSTDVELEHVVNSVVVPRPIAWLTTQSGDGRVNLAPFSYFNLVSSKPPVIMVSFSPSGRKDSLANILDTREFVVNLVSHDVRRTMVASSAEFAAEVDEVDLLELERLPSSVVVPPRLAASPAALECQLHEAIPLFGSTVVLGRVVNVHVDDGVLLDGRVVPEALAAVARLGGSLYTTVTSTYRMPRPSGNDAGSVADVLHGTNEAS